MADFSIVNLADVEDAAAKRGHGAMGSVRFARSALGAETVGLVLHELKPGASQSFGHRHEHAEEVAVVIEGSGRVRLDDEVRELGALDAIRISPRVRRVFAAGPEGMRFLVFGPHHPGDGELLSEFLLD